MITSSSTPLFDSLFPDLNNFLDERVKSFFTSEMMGETESMVRGWKKMASFTDGILRRYVAA
jgi:hypothetical protein